MPGANTHREALLAELIGDVQVLLDRVEALRTGLPAAVETAADQLGATVAQATASVNESGIGLSRAIDRQAKAALLGVQEAAQEASRAAAVVKGAGQRLVALLVVLALLAGGLAGALVTVLLRHAGG